MNQTPVHAAQIWIVKALDATCRVRPLIAIISLLAILAAGCGKDTATAPETAAQEKPPKPLSAPPEVTSEQEDADFHDLIFYIQDFKRLPDGSQSIRGAGTYKGREVGIQVVLGPTWESGVIGSSGTVTYQSVGTESDAFVQVLDELYATKVGPKAISKETKFTAIALEGDPHSLDKGPVKMKLFIESDKQDDYAELYTNIELTEHRLEIAEKDPDYRLPIIQALKDH